MSSTSQDLPRTRLAQQTLAGTCGIATALTTASFSSYSPRSNLAEYFKDSRNVKKLKDPSKCVTRAKQVGRRLGRRQSGLSVWQLLTSASPPPTALRFRLLKHTRLNVVAFLNELPKTQHDINSFVVDISAQTVSTYFSLDRSVDLGKGQSLRGKEGLGLCWEPTW